MLEVVDAIAKEVGADRTGLRISPWGQTAGQCLHVGVTLERVQLTPGCLTAQG